MNNSNPKVDGFLSKTKKWQEELSKLRTILLDSGLTEDLKWGQPCYTIEGKNVIIIHGFKEYCAMLFVKGVLMDDPKGILIQQTENVQAGRQIRFTSAQEIVELELILKKYIENAIAVEKAGLKVPLKKTEEFSTPEELTNQFEQTPGLQEAFEALTPGRQRAYLLFFAAPKQAKTRVARIEKYVPLVLKGKGLNDR